MVFHRNLSDSKSPLVSRTLFSIPNDFNNAVVWMVSISVTLMLRSFWFSGKVQVIISNLTFLDFQSVVRQRWQSPRYCKFFHSFFLFIFFFSLSLFYFISRPGILVSYYVVNRLVFIII